MLTKRVIPCLDVKDGRVVKGVNFVNLRDAGDPVDLANAYDEQGADEVIFLNQGKISLHESCDEIRETRGQSVDALFREVFKCWEN